MGKATKQEIEDRGCNTVAEALAVVNSSIKDFEEIIAEIEKDMQKAEKEAAAVARSSMTGTLAYYSPSMQVSGAYKSLAKEQFFENVDDFGLVWRQRYFEELLYCERTKANSSVGRSKDGSPACRQHQSWNFSYR